MRVSQRSKNPPEKITLQANWACRRRRFAGAGNKVDAVGLASRNLTAGSLLGFDSSLLAHGRENNNI
jgi:hypothetical protein